MLPVLHEPKWKKILALKALEAEHDPLLLRTLSDDELSDALLDMGLEVIAARRDLPPYNPTQREEGNEDQEDPS